jgi:hypothetical protein
MANPRAVGVPPDHFMRRRPKQGPNGQGQAAGTQEPHHATGALQLLELGEDQLQSRLNLFVGIEDNGARTIIGEPRRERHTQFAACRFLPLCRQDEAKSRHSLNFLKFMSRRSLQPAPSADLPRKAPRQKPGQLKLHKKATVRAPGWRPSIAELQDELNALTRRQNRPKGSDDVHDELEIFSCAIRPIVRQVVTAYIMTKQTSSKFVSSPHDLRQTLMSTDLLIAAGLNIDGRLEVFFIGFES